MTPLRLVAVVSLMLCVSSPAWSQTTQPDPWEQQRFRLGALAFTPTIQIKNVGVDTNVFNTVEDPKQDFTFTAGPQVAWWLRAGAVRLHGTSGADYVYFSKYDTESGVNQSHKLTAEYRLNRIRPYVSGSFLDTKDRPGFEIDARARHTETDFRGGAVIRLTAKTRIDLAGFQRQYEFTGDDEFQGTSLAAILNRKTTGGSGTLLFSLTPLTTVTLLGEFGEERFVDEPVRDNSSFRIMPGIELSPDALLKGSAKIGFRKLNMTSMTIPDFQGVVASVSVSYVMLARTRVTVAIARDVQFSHEFSRPYYVLTSLGGAIRQSLAKGFDLEARGAEQRLSYRRATDTPAPLTDRLDKVSTLGAGLGYTLSSGTRIAINAEYTQRNSPINGLGYSGFRAGLGVNLGL